MKLREWAILVAAFLGSYANTAEFDLRVKWFTTMSALPPDDVRRTVTHTPTLDHSADVRIMFKHEGGPWSFEIVHDSTPGHIDEIRLAQRPSIGITSRAMTLSWSSAFSRTAATCSYSPSGAEGMDPSAVMSRVTR